MLYYLCMPHESIGITLSQKEKQTNKPTLPPHSFTRIPLSNFTACCMHEFENNNCEIAKPEAVGWIPPFMT